MKMCLWRIIRQGGVATLLLVLLVQSSPLMALAAAVPATLPISDQISTSQFHGQLNVFSGQPSPPVRPILFVHGINQNANLAGVPQPDPANDKFVPLFQELESVYSQANIYKYQYIDDRALTDNGAPCPPDLFPPCQSQSSVTDNGLVLAAQIQDLFTQTQHKVTLIGYSMGGAIIRTALAGCPDTQGTFACPGLADMVDNVFFINGVQQGSWLLRVRQGFDAAGAVRGVGPIVNNLAQNIYNSVQASMGLNVNYPAADDLTPGSANIQAHNGVPAPSGPAYFNFYGDISAQFVSRIALWTIPGPKASLGDLVLLRGDDNPQATPFWGGARFCQDCGNQNQFSAQGAFAEWPLTDVQQITLLQLIQHPQQTLSALTNAPEMHTNIYSDSSLGGGIQVANTAEQNGTTGIAHEILLLLEREDGILL